MMQPKVKDEVMSDYSDEPQQRADDAKKAQRRASLRKSLKKQQYAIDQQIRDVIDLAQLPQHQSIEKDKQKKLSDKPNSNSRRSNPKPKEIELRQLSPESIYSQIKQKGQQIKNKKIKRQNPISQGAPEFAEMEKLYQPSNQLRGEPEEGMTRKKGDGKIKIQDNEQGVELELTLSMIGSRIQVSNQKPAPVVPISEHEQQHREPEFLGPSEDIQKSVYMQSQNSERQTQPQAEKKHLQKFEVRQDVMYWVSKKLQVKITEQSNQKLAAHFIEHQVMLPFIDSDQFKSKGREKLMKIYTDYLSFYYPDLFDESIARIDEQTNSSQKSTLLPIMSPRSSQGLFKRVWSNLQGFLLNKQEYPKAKSIRKYLNEKMNALDMLAHDRHITASETDQLRERLEHQIAVTEFIICFENAEKICQKQADQKAVDSSLWQKHREEVTGKKKAWMARTADFKFYI